MAISRTSAAKTGVWETPVQFSVAGWFPDLVVDAYGKVHLAWSQSRYVYEAWISLPTLAPTLTPSITPSPTITPTITATRSFAATFTATPSQTLTPSITPGGPTRTPTITLSPTIAPIYGFDVVFYTTSQDGKNWAEVNDILALQASSGVEVTRPKMLIDNAGFFHMTFRGRYVYYSRSTISSSDSARQWQEPLRISTLNMGYFSTLIQDNNKRLHLFYTENVQLSECWICYHLYHRYSDDHGETWADQQDVSVVNAGAAKPDVLVDEDNTVHVVWESGPGGTLGGVELPVEILYTRSTDGGTTWETPLQLTNAEILQARNPSIALDGQGRLLAVWVYLIDDRYYSITSDDKGKTWSAPSLIPNVWGEQRVRDTRQDASAMKTDSKGAVHLIFTGRLAETDPSLSLLHVTWNQGRWTEVERIVNYPNGDAPEWPRVAISNGNKLHVAWFVRPRSHLWDANPAYYTIWYTNRMLDAPPREDKLYQTETLAPSPLPASPTFTPSSTPKLARTPTAPNAMELANNEEDDLGAIAKSVLPSVGLVAVVLLVTLLRRKR